MGIGRVMGKVDFTSKCRNKNVNISGKILSKEGAAKQKKKNLNKI